VAHDGGSERGESAQTFTLTDVHTGWMEMQTVQNKAPKWVFPAINLLVSLLPFALKGLIADSGGEFININLLTWCQQNNAAFTRSRPYRKNDNAHVEQKNNCAVRRAMEYLRYDTREELCLLNQIHAQLWLVLSLHRVPPSKSWALCTNGVADAIFEFGKSPMIDTTWKY